MKKNDYFLDVSGYQPADLTGTCAAAGTTKTIIKVSESTNYLNSFRFTQAQTSEPIGYYHFARFGGSSAQANAEAYYFLSNLPTTDVHYLVVDYEDSASGDKQANTNAVITFMDRISEAGYQPIYYSYKPFTLSNVYYDQVIAKYHNSLWIAAYPNYNVTPEPIWSVFPSLDGIRWWQFTSTAIAGGLDKNVVLLDDDFTSKKEEIKEENSEEEEMNLVVRSKSGNQGYFGIVNGEVFGIGDWDTVVQLQNAGAKHLVLDDGDFDRLISSQREDYKEIVDAVNKHADEIDKAIKTLK